MRINKNMKLILNKAKTEISKLKFTTGFTLIELLVTITIFSILTGVVLFNQQKFNSTILLTNLAYDTALTFRQAQTYGINIKEFNTGKYNYDDQGDIVGQFIPYGVHFNMISPNSFILFADLTYDHTTNISSGLYPSEASLSICNSDTNGCVQRYNITKGNYIKAICSEAVDKDKNECSDTNSLDNLSISFVRPNPNAIIRSTNKTAGENLEAATIILSGATNDNFKKVRVWKSGLIEILN